MIHIDNQIGNPHDNKDRVEALLAHILLCDDVMQFAREVLRPSDFDLMGESLYQITLREAYSHYDQNHRLPPEEILTTEVASIMSGDAAISSEVVAEARRFLAWAYHEALPQPSDREPAVAKHWLIELLKQRKVQRQLEDAIQNSCGCPIPNIADLLQRCLRAYEELASVAVCSASVIGDEIAQYNERLEHWRSRDLVGLRTGLTILDERTCGLRGLFVLGAAPGGGKTLLALQLAMSV